ncbi:ABC-type uncharacterized transport system, permease component [Marinobacter daqiaonensis]|uniref:ABC-type uncharacterized transport system, permease component n=1 Tax=Marinobacter daqiaonensis TaxID=650891 RepID=A0A1I6J773_9GAMM|nr:cytochrome c biogenesis protein CcsA [Marinobacter daqiaonensis]SFR74809.1 ABC-type uncharacterized transport system, permease component [Marinobacter daqiaonensis]
MGTLILAVTTLFLYSIGTTLQALSFRGRISISKSVVTVIGGLGLVAHTLLLWQILLVDGAVNLGFFQSSLLISWLVVALLLAMNLTRPLDSLFLGAYPLACLTVVFALMTHTPPRFIERDEWGVLSHIALSVTAYSLFTLAAGQALLVYLQNRQLKHNYNSPLVRNLPPLQTMESLLFELLWAGVILLVLAIVTGAIFVSDLFAQDLAHKTVFSLISLVVFSALLVGRQIQGWRGITASRWTLAGCVLLMIAYYGSKFVLELVFHRAG